MMVDSPHYRSQQPESKSLVLVNHKKVFKDGKIFKEPIKLPINRILTSKYTLINFLPKNLFYQFRRIGNFYFLITTIIQLTIDSPVSPATSLVPLLFVILTTSIKQGYEDWLRHISDTITNSRLIPLIKNGNVIEIKSENIKIGDIIKVKEEEEIPCDLIILSSSNTDGICSITTANLDGETNLKKKFSVNITKHCINSTDLSNINGFIECEEPNCDLYDFSGLLTIKQNGFHTVSLGAENLLLRGSRLINTSFIYGVAIYTGNLTKMSLNSKVTKIKFSSIERSINYYLLLFLTILIAFCVSNLYFRYRLVENSEQILNEHWYLKYAFFKNFDLSFESILSNFFNFFVLYNYLIPISLYVSLEMTRFFSSKIMIMKKNFDPLGNIEDSKLICNCSDMNEDLGQIKYFFSDKTGTLTENVMKFVRCIIDGQVYQIKDRNLFKKLDNNEVYEKIELNNRLNFFFICLALCNTVDVKKKNVTEDKLSCVGLKKDDKDSQLYDKIHFEYIADSPDEKAFVKTCSYLGIKLIGSSKEEYSLNINGKFIKYKMLNIIEFDSIRKRMSVIVKDDNNQVILICKGAESELIDLITKGEIQKTYSYIDEFANQGLRTMIITYKYLTEIEYKNFLIEYDKVNNCLKNRKKLFFDLFKKVENRLYLFGATAIEDKLQENVEKTILDIKEAGINIWLLTGDKLETAVSVAYSCKLIQKDYHVMFLSRQKNTVSCGEKLAEHWFYMKSTLKYDRANLIVYKKNLFGITRKITLITELITKLLNQIITSIQTNKNLSESVVEISSIEKQSLLEITEKADDLVKLEKMLNLLEENNLLEFKEKLHGIDRKLIQILKDLKKTEETIARKPKCTIYQLPYREIDLKIKLIKSKLFFSKNLDITKEINISRKLNLEEKFALILDGRSLYIALKYHKEIFQLICEYCTVTICSRMSPIQKAEIVKMVKNFSSKPITAAIGDGANDVSMIQEANIGFGLMGKEGLQAVRNADFAFSKFKYVKNIMLIDGHFFYERMCYLIHYFFFKSLVFIVPQYLYSHYNMYSGQTLYHGMLLMTYNLLFTATPIFIKSILEEYISKFFLDEYPILYKTISSNAHMNIKIILKSILLSTLQGTFIFYSTKFFWPSTVTMLENGKTTGIFSFGLIIFHVVVLVVNLKILIECCKFENFLIITLLGSILSLPTYIYIYSSFQWNFIDNEFYGQYNSLILSASFWITIFIITFITLLPDLIYSIIEASFRIKFIKQLILNKNKKKV